MAKWNINRKWIGTALKRKPFRPLSDAAGEKETRAPGGGIPNPTLPFLDAKRHPITVTLRTLGSSRDTSESTKY